jgi:DNA helicase-2/ATP-dependent DNA helicase PcrA
MTTRQDYNDYFFQILQQLNPDQTKAVEQIEGPVLVVAGPGTGKTHILSARIGRILMETDTRAYNILCLTFTDAGVKAMRERLLQFIGPEAHRVHIFTFHSFCNNIIQDNPSLFGSNALEPISELEQVELIQEMLDELPVTHVLKRGRSNPYFYLMHLQNLFQLMKREHWTADLVKARIKTYLEDLPSRQEYIYKVNSSQYKKGDVKAAQLEDMQVRMERLEAAAALFPRYVNGMRKMRRYDYEDMILWVLQAFEKHPSLLRRYQEQYLYFLVDEYQDTNGAQNQILQHLMDFWHSPNVFIVGDDDQSVYEFQGARLKNISDFYNRYEQDVDVVLLKNNYRSTQPLLDTAFNLIEQNEKRLLRQLGDLGLEKKLISTSSNTSILPQIVEYPNRLQEAVDIVDQIEQLQQQGFPLNEIAVIYARHRQAETIIQLLEKRRIPYDVKRKVNALDLPLITNLRLFLRYLQAEYIRPYSGEADLFALLHSDFLQINPRDLATLSLYMARQEKRLYWRDVIHQLATDQLEVSIANKAALQRFDDFLQRALQDYRNLPLPMLLERLFNRSGLLQFILKADDKDWKLQVLHTFFDFVQHEATRQPKITIKNLLQTLQNMETNRIRLDVNKQTMSEDGVQLVTAHSSKGLEFEKVYMIDCVKDYWEASRRQGHFKFTLPDTLTYSGEEDAMEARRRLFYVGITRTKRDLHISYAVVNRKGKALLRAVFVDELLMNPKLEVVAKKIESEAVLMAQEHLLLETILPTAPKLPAYQVRELLQQFRLSISSMNTYLRCPISFFYEYVLNVPTLMSEAATYGEAMHRALERLYADMLGRKTKVFPSERQLLRSFEEELKNLQHQLSDTEFQRRLELGRKNLSYFYQHVLSTLPKKAQVEYKVRHCEVDGIPLTGTIDLLTFVDTTTAKIFDYKTGRADAKKLRRPTATSPLGGSYYRQLVFYKLLYENHRVISHVVKEGEILFLDPNQRGNYLRKSIRITAKDVEHVKNLIQQTYAKIQAQDFYDGCGESHCQWCNFVQRNELVDSLQVEAIELLDD